MSALGYEVSVVIPTHNRAKLVCQAVRSCIEQPVAIEVLVVDDGSVEPIQATLRNEFGCRMDNDSSFPVTSRLIFVRQKKQGACTARNTGLARATGDYVKFLDSDDVLLPNTLDKELEAARSSQADVIVTGWEERACDEQGRDISEHRRLVPAPDLRRGIDDMLLGRGPCVSAAFYRREFIKHLRWDPDWTKAQDWGWALTVCLAGARFVALDIPSSVYYSHMGERITSQADRSEKSTQARQYFLRMIEERLREQGKLTPDRKQKLAQYYYKDRQMICKRSPEAWRELWSHCQELAPGFKPRETGRIATLFILCFGVYYGIRWYVFLKTVAGPFRAVSKAGIKKQSHLFPGN